MWKLKYYMMGKFLEIVKLFGNPSVLHNTLTVDFRLIHGYIRPLKWFIRALGGFTNFRTVELHFDRLGVRDRTFSVIEYFEHALEPMLGRSEHSSREGKGLRFHPIDHRKRLIVLDHGDWADSLDGIRLEWNTDDSKIPVQN